MRRSLTDHYDDDYDGNGTKNRTKINRKKFLWKLLGFPQF